MKTEIKLSDKWIQRLRELPETHMGSQHVDVVLHNGDVVSALPVFNGKYLQLKGHIFSDRNIADMRLHIEK